MNLTTDNVKKKFSIIGNSKLLNHAIETALQVAPTDLSIIITGENGVGKEFFAKIIHNFSKRKHKKCIAINCGAMPEGTIDSELFGHEKGSFTGAHDVRKGYFEEANEGTIFLDEIGEMPLNTQTKLLRLLEQKEYLRVGSSKILKCNVRVIAATNKNLLELIDKGVFRQDLYYRLSTVPIYVPSLKERSEDIVLLFNYFTREFSDQYNIDPIKLSIDAQKLLQRYAFPGNIRQLKNIANQISILQKQRYVTSDILKKYLPIKSDNQISLYKNNEQNINDFKNIDIIYKTIYDLKKELDIMKNIVFKIENNRDIPNTPIVFSTTKPISIDKKNYTENKLKENLSIEENEKTLIEKALSKNKLNRKLAAKELGISERTLYRKIKYYKM